MVKKYKVVTPIHSNSVLNHDDRTKFAAFVALLVQVNKRVNPASRQVRRASQQEEPVIKKTRAKRKIKEGSLENCYNEGSLNRGPLFYWPQACALTFSYSTADACF